MNQHCFYPFPLPIRNICHLPKLHLLYLKNPPWLRHYPQWPLGPSTFPPQRPSIRRNHWIQLGTHPPKRFLQPADLAQCEAASTDERIEARSRKLYIGVPGADQMGRNQNTQKTHTKDDIKYHHHFYSTKKCFWFHGYLNTISCCIKLMLTLSKHFFLLTGTLSKHRPGPKQNLETCIWKVNQFLKCSPVDGSGIRRPKPPGMLMGWPTTFTSTAEP